MSKTKPEFIYWDEKEDMMPVRRALASYEKNSTRSIKKPDGKAERLYRIFQKLSKQQQKKFIKLIENYL